MDDSTMAMLFCILFLLVIVLVEINLPAKKYYGGKRGGSMADSVKTENEWLMLLKKVPDNVFMLFFEDNPEMRYVAEDYEVDEYLSPEDRLKMQDEVNKRRSVALSIAASQGII
jgi:hypothetical protein